MKNPFQPGDVKTYALTVTPDKLARFPDQPGGGLIHPVYGTFALGQDAEWCCRLFVLDMLEVGEQGVGSLLTVEHLSPAPQGSRVTITATLEAVEGRRVRCRYQAHVLGSAGERLIAQGVQEQRIVDAARFAQSLADFAP